MNKLPDVEAEEDGYQILAYILFPSVGLSVSAMAAIASVLLFAAAVCVVAVARPKIFLPPMRAGAGIVVTASPLFALVQTAVVLAAWTYQQFLEKAVASFAM